MWGEERRGREGYSSIGIKIPTAKYVCVRSGLPSPSALLSPSSASCHSVREGWRVVVATGEQEGRNGEAAFVAHPSKVVPGVGVGVEGQGGYALFCGVMRLRDDWHVAGRLCRGLSVAT